MRQDITDRTGPLPLHRNQPPDIAEDDAEEIPMHSGIADRDAAELRRLAGAIEAWRAAQGLSRNQLLRTISGLNSKTFGKILREDFSGLNPENHLKTFRAAWAECEAYDQRQEKEIILRTLPPAEAVLGAVFSVKLNRGIQRFVLIEGESGAGKTEALRLAAAETADAVYVSASEAWTFTPSYAVKSILKACGVTYPEKAPMPLGFTRRLEDLLEALRNRPRCLLVDEGQHVSAVVLNVLKEIINTTGSWVVLGTMSSLWRKVQSERWAEVKQLLHNRMHLRVILPPPDADAVEAYMESRLGLKVEEGKTAASQAWQKAFNEVARAARHHGLYAYVRKVAAAARHIALQAERTDLKPEDLIIAAASVATNTKGFDRE